jgi:acetylglutamate kinase
MTERANILIEALPYIRRFYQKTVVIKYGGHAMVAEDLKESFAKDIVLMKYIGINPVVVHGGGPQIGNMLRRIGKKSDFYEGMRITDADTMDIVEMVLAGKVNKEIVALINHQGGLAIGLSGKDGQLIEARKLQVFRDMGDDQPPEIMDIGHVGEVSRVNLDILKTLEQSNIIPVIAPIGVGKSGETYNINADLVAGAIAGALKAAKLLLMTDVSGVLDKDGSLISSMTIAEAETAMQNETLRGGMIPKIQCAVDALKAGAEKVHIVDGRLAHAIILEMFTDAGIGTEILRSRGQEK